MFRSLPSPLLACALTIAFALVLAPRDSRAQSEANPVLTSASNVSVRLTGTLQPRLSFGRTDGGDEGESLDRLGFGLRRARLRTTVSFENRVGVHYDVDVRGGSLASVDLYGFYRPADGWRVRVGYLAGAQPRSYIPTSHTRLDGIERAAIAERWSDVTIGSRGRDFGVDVRRTTAQTHFELFLHNGDGNFDPTRGNFRQAAGDNDATRGVDRTSMAVSGAFRFTPEAVEGLELGGFAGYNAHRGPYTAVEDDAPGRSYGSWSAHAYWGANPGSQPVRLKVDVIGIHYESGATADGTAVDARAPLGWAVFGAVAAVEHTELFARYEEFDADDGADADAYWTFGTSWSRSAARELDYRQERLTLAYTNALPGALPGAEGARDEHLVVLQWQWVW